jgi:hypothetical protein
MIVIRWKKISTTISELSVEESGWGDGWVVRLIDEWIADRWHAKMVASIAVSSVMSLVGWQEGSILYTKIWMIIIINEAISNR